jgi:hypothetical protein
MVPPEPESSFAYETLLPITDPRCQWKAENAISFHNRGLLPKQFPDASLSNLSPERMEIPRRLLPINSEIEQNGSILISQCPPKTTGCPVASRKLPHPRILFPMPGCHKSASEPHGQLKGHMTVLKLS